MGTGNQVDSSASVTDSVPARRSATSVAQLSLSKDSVTVCSACGHDGESFHRLKHDGTARHFCSSCILFLYKGMYCCLCFLVYETPGAKGDSSLWVSCLKCQRIGHAKCARDHDLHIDSASFTCPKCSQTEKASALSHYVSTESQASTGSPPLKRLRSSGDGQRACTPSDDDQRNVHAPPEEVLAAAQIVALLAVQHAKDAKARARASAAVAARAAACAKAALDTAYRVAQEEARWKPESSRRLSGGGLSSISAISAPKNMRVDGGVPTPRALPYSNALSPNDQLGKGHTTSYIPLNARVTTQYNKMKALPPSAVVIGAAQRTGTFQKPQAVHVQEALEGVQNGGPTIEPEVINVSASPANILDASASLDTPRPSSSAEPGPGDCCAPDAAPNERVSSTMATRNNFSSNSAHLQTSKHQNSTIDKKDQRVDDAAQIGAKEVANSKPSNMHSCEVETGGMSVGPNFSGKEKQTGDSMGDVLKNTEQK